MGVGTAGHTALGNRIPRALARAFCFVGIPMGLSAGGVRYFLPAHITGRLIVFVALFVFFSFIVRVWAPEFLGMKFLSGALRPLHKRGWHARLGDLASVLVAIGLALVIRAKIGLPFEVASASMLPTLLPGDTLLVTKVNAAEIVPRRGDVIIFRSDKKLMGGPSPEGGPGLFQDQLVKRVIGLPGDRISVEAGIATINGWEVPHCDAGTYLYLAPGRSVVGRLLVEFLDGRAYLTVHTPQAQNFSGTEVKPGEFFVLGDDRNASNDSRSWNGGRGAGVPTAAILGRPWRVIGADRSGHVDFRRFLKTLDLKPYLPSMDTQDLEAGLQRCLNAAPKNTSPPPRTQ